MIDHDDHLFNMKVIEEVGKITAFGKIVYVHPDVAVLLPELCARQDAQECRGA